MTEYGRIHTDGSRSGGQPVLKPCPFCGGEPKWYEGKFCASVKCDNGHAIHEYKPTLIEAIAAWNTRQPIQSDMGIPISDDTWIDEFIAVYVAPNDVTHVADFLRSKYQPTQSDALRDQLLQECLIKLRDVQGTEAPKQYACNLIKRIERVLQEQSE